jgi:anti-anti-sigma regulatory factor
MAANPVPRVAGELRIVSENKPSKITVQPRGAITSATCLALERNLVPKFRCIVLDLSHVDRIDNAALAAVMSLYMHAKRANCDLVLDNPRPRLGKRLRNWLHAVFEGHQDFLGMTPD